MNAVLIAVILGLVEGVTEFLPVSSTGHLIVAGRLLGYQGEKAATFEIFIQLGAILAVLLVERRRFLGLLVPAGRAGFAGPRGIGLLALTTFPALVAGYLLHDLIKTRLFGPVTVAAALVAGGIVLLAIERSQRAARTDDVDGLGWGQALAIGLAQCFALWPGVSRSGATIVGGMLCGLERRTAVTYSFLAAVPVMVAATLYDLWKSRGALSSADLLPFSLGFLVSMAAAILALRAFVGWLGRRTLRPFGWYRILVAPFIYFFVS